MRCPLPLSSPELMNSGIAKCKRNVSRGAVRINERSGVIAVDMNVDKFDTDVQAVNQEIMLEHSGLKKAAESSSLLAEMVASVGSEHRFQLVLMAQGGD